MVDGHGWNEVKEENARNACRTARHGTARHGTARHAIDHSAFRGIAQEARAGGQREGGPARRPGQRTARRASLARGLWAPFAAWRKEPDRARFCAAISRRAGYGRFRRCMSAERQKAPHAAKSAYPIRHAYSAHAELSRSLMPPLAEITDPHSCLVSQFIDFPKNYRRDDEAQAKRHAIATSV
ncbi:hypothetical protein [Burkholderia multivorans]|uniref:hypothetical protein n=1 Tax=Burkholderia multivorans TaxID=87883 RepID=UPI0015E3B11E|nr:hypothetical protein [Burkholderia multivorans]